MNRPTKPGFYWWRRCADSVWQPAEVAGTPLVNVARMGVELEEPLESGEWGPEIVHGD